MPKKYIGKKFENGTWYNMYYDETLKMMSLTECGDEDLELFYSPKEEDLVAMASKICLQRIVDARKAKMYREQLKKNILSDFYVLVFAILSGLAMAKLSEPITQYNIKYIVTDDESRDELALDYVREVIDTNPSINKDFKKYLLSFFKSLNELDYSFNRNSMNRMLDNIKSKNFEYVSFDDQDSVVAGLAEVINDQSQVSVAMASLEYYEQYNESDASFKTRLFDAINARTDNKLLAGIIDDGDSYYKEYLCEKYGITKDKAEDAIIFIKIAYTYVGYKYEKYEDYINSILAFNYNFGENYLYRLESETNYNDLANGRNKYSYNLFGNLIKFTISNGYCTYDAYFDTEYCINVTSSEYYKRFDELISNFDFNIDVSDPNDRMLLYLYTMASLTGDKKDQESSSNSYIFGLGEEYFDDVLYSYLSGNDYDVERICDVIVGLAMTNELDEEDLVLLTEVLIALNKEKEIGKITPYCYEVIFKDLSYLVNETADKETFLEWQDNVISNVEPEGVNEIIKKYRSGVSRLTKREN